MTDRLVLTAGKTRGPVQGPASPRRVLLAEIRRIVRDPQSTDAQVEDALEALVELRDTPEG